MYSIWAIWTCSQPPPMCSDETMWNGCAADKYPSGCENSLFLLELGNNKESEVFQQHEAHQERNGSAYSWGYDDGERVVHHPHCRQGQKTRGEGMEKRNLHKPTSFLEWTWGYRSAVRKPWLPAVLLQHPQTWNKLVLPHEIRAHTHTIHTAVGSFRFS